MAANMKRVETVEMVSTLLDDLVTSVLRLVSDKQTGGGRASEHGAAGIADDDTIEGEDDVGDQSGILCTISDAEREADNNSRMKILLHLLELACAMVHVYTYIRQKHVKIKNGRDGTMPKSTSTSQRGWPVTQPCITPFLHLFL